MILLVVTFLALLVTVILLNYSGGAAKPKNYLPSWYLDPPYLPPCENTVEAENKAIDAEFERMRSVIKGAETGIKPTEKDCNPLLQQPSFVPVEAERVPSQAHYSNKFNDVIGNETSGIFGPIADPEIYIPSDWYMSAFPPTEFDGKYWPKGTIEYDFIYPGSDPERPLRPQNLYASQIISLGS
jgi:hypothetical protein